MERKSFWLKKWEWKIFETRKCRLLGLNLLPMPYPKVTTENRSQAPRAKNGPSRHIRGSLTRSWNSAPLYKITDWRAVRISSTSRSEDSSKSTCTSATKLWGSYSGTYVEANCNLKRNDRIFYFQGAEAQVVDVRGWVPIPTTGWRCRHHFALSGVRHTGEDAVRGTQSGWVYMGQMYVMGRDWRGKHARKMWIKIQ